MLSRPARHGALLGLAVAVLSCFGGVPSAPVGGSLAPNAAGSGPRHRAAFAVVFAGPQGTVLDRRRAVVTGLFNPAMRDIDAPDTENLPAITLPTAEDEPIAGYW